MPLRVKQTLVILAGVLVAAVMTWLGLWQLQVFTDQGNASAHARAQQAPVALLDFVAPNGTVGDIYGKPVTVSGHYLAGQQVLVLGPDGVVRVLSALQLSDGRVLPVVRGTVARGAEAGVAPSGERSEVGIFLPSEPGADHALARGYDLGSVRLPQLAQLWTEPLMPGFVTLSGEESARQGLSPATVTLPEGEGSWRNSGYALQWWVFALFGLGMSWRIAHSMGKRRAGSPGMGSGMGSPDGE
ncbi:MAG: SURF1 family protein [Micropruina sp.]|uniref:SURF1 family protein n=1 Tax=Micropruina sp. TaxID=2737536 RepID=UPI0039E29989